MIENETKGQRNQLLPMFLGTIGASLLTNMLAGKRVIRACHEVHRAKLNF